LTKWNIKFGIVGKTRGMEEGLEGVRNIALDELFNDSVDVFTYDKAEFVSVIPLLVQNFTRNEMLWRIHSSENGEISDDEYNALEDSDSDDVESQEPDEEDLIVHRLLLPYNNMFTDTCTYITDMTIRERIVSVLLNELYEIYNIETFNFTNIFKRMVNIRNMLQSNQLYLMTGLRCLCLYWNLSPILIYIIQHCSVEEYISGYGDNFDTNIIELIHRSIREGDLRFVLFLYDLGIRNSNIRPRYVVREIVRLPSNNRMIKTYNPVNISRFMAYLTDHDIISFIPQILLGYNYNLIKYVLDHHMHNHVDNDLGVFDIDSMFGKIVQEYVRGRNMVDYHKLIFMLKHPFYINRLERNRTDLEMLLIGNDLAALMLVVPRR
jgi:hypothetical protein